MFAKPSAPWFETPYGADRRTRVSDVLALALPCGADWTIRLAEAGDADDLARLSRTGFARHAPAPGQPSRLYAPDWFCENRLGWILRLVCAGSRGVQAYGIAQVRAEELYLYEIVATSAPGRPGQGIFHALVAVAAALGLRHVTAMLSRADTHAAMLRLSQRLGMRPAPLRGYTLAGELQNHRWTWLRGETKVLNHLHVNQIHTRGGNRDE